MMMKGRFEKDSFLKSLKGDDLNNYSLHVIIRPKLKQEDAKHSAYGEHQRQNPKTNSDSRLGPAF